MNRLKPIFISLATTVWAYFTYLLILEIIHQTSILSMVGFFLVSALPFGFFMVLLSAKPLARTSKSLLFITSLIIIGALLVFFGVYQNNLSQSHVFVASGSVIMWLLYIGWYSFLPKSKTELAVGNILPELTFSDQGNKQVSSFDFKGKKVLYMFYRGNWCPLCMAQIKEISAQYNELEKRGVEVLLISPQPESHSAGLAKKMKVNFHFLTDTNNTMARKMKIDQTHGIPLGFEVFGYKSETVLPTVIVTDEEGKIIFFDQTDNYRVRPEPETFLNVIDVKS